MKSTNQRQDEKWVMESLIKQGFDAVLCLSDPPDLIVNGNIGVEVRRLNQHYFTDGKYESTEKANQSFKRILQAVINGFSNPDQLPSAMICYTMFRPLLGPNENRKIIKKVLTDHIPFIDQSREYAFDRMEIRIDPWFKPMEKRYFIGAMHDGNKGGFVQSMAVENFPIALNSKEKDLSRYQSAYNECWLALIDEMYLWHDEKSLIEMAVALNIETNFDKILLFSPFKHFAFTTLFSKL